MAAKIKQECDIKAKLTPGKRGEFTVKYNGEVIAQKNSDFPSFSRIVEIVLKKQQGE